MASAVAAVSAKDTEEVEDMFRRHIKEDSCMRGRWLYFGKDNKLIEATLALLPKWKDKERKLRIFHDALMDKSKRLMHRHQLFKCEERPGTNNVIADVFLSAWWSF